MEPATISFPRPIDETRRVAAGGPDCAICYVTDPGFLVPTLVSASSIRRYVGGDRASVLVFTLEIPTEIDDDLSAIAKDLDVQIIPLEADLLKSVDLSKFNKTHVPISTLGRLLTASKIPAHIRKVIYIDGDTLIVKDPAPLLAAEVPIGKIGAAEDYASFCRNDATEFGAKVRRYMADLGLHPDADYFNAGVLVSERQTWSDLTAEALEFFLGNVERCKYHDQSALNAVAVHRRYVLSNRWNFQTEMNLWMVSSTLKPAILHFSQAPKPWLGSVPPWRSYSRYYEEWKPLFDRVAGNLTARFDDREVVRQRKAFALRKAMALTFRIRRTLSRRKKVLDLSEHALV